MEGWNPFGKVDMEIGSFLKLSKFNKVYSENSNGKAKDAEIGQKSKGSSKSNTSAP